MNSPRAMVNWLAAAAIAAAATLYRFPPHDYPFYPRCPFFALTHHYCPGCGATRALSALLHGHLSDALHFNAAVTLLFPLALACFAAIYWTALRHNRLEWPRLPAWTWKFALASTAVFGIARLFVQSNL